jgi:hypothetical protein
MEGFILNILATAGFSSVFLVIFFSIYYLYLKGVGEKVQEEYNVKDKSKRLGKGF